MFNLGIAYGAKVGIKLRLDKGMESASARCPLGCFGVTPFEENGLSDPTWTTGSLHPFPLSRCSVGCRWMGHEWLNYAWKSSGRSGQKWAILRSKNTVRLYGQKCAKESLTPHKERTLQCSKRYNKVRFAQVGEQCTSMCGVDTEEGQVISAV